MTNKEVLSAIKGGLIVSCQALPEEPLHSDYIMSRMAVAAQMGGAVGIRANSVKDILAIKKVVNLPIIGLIKQVYSDSEVYITPTMKEVDDLVHVGADIIAIDATNRIRPGGITLDSFFREVRKKFPDKLFMADCSCYEEGIHAEELGFDLVGTTLSGYTSYTKGTPLPNFDLMKRLSAELKVPVIAEGGIWSPEELKTAIKTGVYACVVGSAITRPMEITHRFVQAISNL